MSSQPSPARASHKNNLVLGVDIGTTYSAVSFCISTNDATRDPVFHEVNRWPRQSIAGAKIPSVLYYNDKNIVQLCGAETEDVDSLMEADEHNWKKAEWWKLLLRPEYIAMPNGHSILPLPFGLTIEDVFSHFFVYIKENVRTFIVNSYSRGNKYWQEFAGTMIVILTTPNGWEGRHQNLMREAAIKAKLLVGDRVRERVRFVSEGEAAIHHMYESTKQTGCLSIGDVILVCDAGGGTTDIGIYRIQDLHPLQVEEVSRPQCYIAGGVFVNLVARKFIEGRLKGSSWNYPRIVDLALKNFEQNAKRKFTESDRLLHVEVGGYQSDEAHGVVRGRLKLTREDLASFFDPFIKIVLDGLSETVTNLAFPVNEVVLIGGFTESPYVHSRIATWCKDHNLSLMKPDGPLSKAMTDGALSWHRYSGVRTRIARFHYGAEVQVLYDPDDPEMAGREKYMDPKGVWQVRGAWKEIVRKDARLQSGAEHSAWFHREIPTLRDAEVEMELFAYRWLDPPRFLRNRDGILNDGFIFIGTVKGNLRQYFLDTDYETNSRDKKKRKKSYKLLQYEVCLSFDEIEIKAALCWHHMGDRMTGEATLVYDI